MPTYKRYIYKDGEQILFFSRKPRYIQDRTWSDLIGSNWPKCFIQEKELGCDIADLPERRLVEVEITIKKR